MTVKVSMAVPVPSPTVSVMSAEPDCPVTRVTVTVRFAPLPPNTTLATGTSAVLLDPAVSVKAAAAVSTSPTVTVRGPTAVPAIV